MSGSIEPTYHALCENVLVPVANIREKTSANPLGYSLRRAAEFLGNL